MQHGMWTKSAAEQPRFPFTGKPSINVDSVNPSNPLEYFEFLCTPENAEVIARETNQYAKNFFGYMPNIKVRFRTHHWKE
jgi:hypothetical protein